MQLNAPLPFERLNFGTQVPFLIPDLFLPGCILHCVLFISVDSLNETMSANMSDSDFYGGEF